MSRGKHLSLGEARKQGKLEQFAKEHPAEGDRNKFDRLLKAMASALRRILRGNVPFTAGRASIFTRAIARQTPRQRNGRSE